MNIKDLRDSLVESFGELKAGKLKNKDAKELTNLAGKIIMTAKTELDYNKYMKTEKRIDFFETDDEIVETTESGQINKAA
ncbi:hypothetical protein [Flavobacterium sp.]|jgi:hypothetical protein|uniref:hypothetical protein n=1 Tax=Flavobacterium sp. TaxID=239 RepID=UPI0037C00203